MLGSLLTQWTIRLALACFAAYLAGNLLGLARCASIDQTAEPRAKFTANRNRAFRWLRWIWTAGCLLFIAHVVCAFQFTHHWSHTHAWEHTAAETKRMLGVAFGDGIYFSYIFLLLWVADVACLWLAIRRPGWVVAAVYLFLFFIAFNGAIVFESGPTRPVGIVVVTAMLPLLVLFVWKQWRDLATSQKFQRTTTGKEPLPSGNAECEA
ncbi:hypothetical protein ETAA8_02470 [Anatilimnocola aggregata]|uniref:Uncharacterized protein n=1 Tax=Anatilimnocola aggregata TaxID=2528021 RepID=A0A517Y4M1_9BACT|nr:hypothetical protein [Anatilimnocola aggregata]QDU25184.1 hypothetical protein ETAA8_02470 [Anatilimnocola aggregata]